VLALAAGCDLLCLGPDTAPAGVEDVRAAVVSAVAEGRLSRERLADAAGRVGAMHVSATATGDSAPDAERQVEAVAAALLVTGELPDLGGAVVVSVETVANIAVGAVAWGLPPDHRLDAASLVLPAAVADDVSLVVQVRDAHRRPEVLAFLTGLAEAGRSAVVVEWGWPGAYDVGLPTIRTRGSSGPGVTAVEQLLREAGWTR
jgi:beta-N-acetylhexosaminidase